MLKKIIFILLGAFLFLLPFKIQTVLFQTPLFLQGQFNSYTTFFLTLPDLILPVILILIGIDSFRSSINSSKKHLSLWLCYALFGLLIASGLASFFWASDQKAVLVSLGRLLIGTLIPFVLLSSQYFKEKREILLRIFVISMAIQACIGIIQFLMQNSIGLHLFVESYISPSEPGIAKIDILNKKIIRSYGTFPHPNIFGGFLVLATFLATQILKNKKHKFAVVLLFLVALIFTFSRSAWLAGIIGFFLLAIIHKKNLSWKLIGAGIGLLGIIAISVIPLIQSRFNILEDAAIRERWNGIETSINMIKKNPLGVGAGNYTVKLQNYTQEKLAPWEYQPVHNVFLLELAELGFHGVLIFLALIVVLIIHAARKNKTGLIYAGIFITLGLFDHYFFTIPQGQSLLALFLILQSA